MHEIFALLVLVTTNNSLALSSTSFSSEFLILKTNLEGGMLEHFSNIFINNELKRSTINQA
jgi:hypothetical protein